MPRSPSKSYVSKINMDSIHKYMRYIIGLAVFATLITAVVFSSISSNLITEVHDEGSNPNNTADSSLSDKEQDLQINTQRALYSYLFTVLLVLIYIAMKM